MAVCWCCLHRHRHDGCLLACIMFVFILLWLFVGIARFVVVSLLVLLLLLFVVSVVAVVCYIVVIGVVAIVSFVVIGVVAVFCYICSHPFVRIRHTSAELIQVVCCSP